MHAMDQSRRTRWAGWATGAVLACGVLAVESGGQVCSGLWVRGDGIPGRTEVRFFGTRWDPDGPGPRGQVILTAGPGQVGDLAVEGPGGWDPVTETWSPLDFGPEGSEFINRFSRTAPIVDAVGDVIAADWDGLQARIARWNRATRAWEVFGVAEVSAPGRIPVKTLLALPNGDIVVGGDLVRIGGVPVNRIARWSRATGTWSSLAGGVDPGAGTLTQSTVSLLRALAGGDIIASGVFSVAGGVTARNIARWSASSETWAPLGTGLSAAALSLVEVPDGDLIVSGEFGEAGGTPATRVARWNAATSSWSALGAGLNGFVSSLVIDTNGDLLAAGRFSRSGATPTGPVARWDPANSRWTAFGGGLGLTSTNSLIARDLAVSISVLPGGDLLAGGIFERAGDTPVLNMARWVRAESAWVPIGTGMNQAVYAVATTPDGDVIAGGSFQRAGAVRASGIARWNRRDGSWSALGSGVAFEGDAPFVAGVAVLDDGDVIATGRFSSAGGLAASNIARWDAQTQTWNPIGEGLDGVGRALARLPSGEVLVGGEFSAADGVAAGSIASWNPATGIWSPLGSGTDGAVLALSVGPDGRIVAGGAFSTAGGIPARSVAVWNPATNSWSALGGGDPSAVRPIYAVLWRSNGDILTGGEGDRRDGITIRGLGLWSAAENAWTSAGGGVFADFTGQETGVVYSLLPRANGDVLVGGTFVRAGTLLTTNVARLSLATGVWTALDGGVTDVASASPMEVGEQRTNGVHAFAQLPSGEIFLGGGFVEIGHAVSGFTARWNETGRPTISQSPASTSIAVSGTLRLEAWPSPGSRNLRVQWRRNGVDVTDGPGGAAPGGGSVSGASVVLASPSVGEPAVLTILGVRPEDGGVYSAVFSNTCGSTSTADATVTITPGACLGDFNRDGVVLASDVFAFTSAYFAGCLAVGAGPCQFGSADVDGDAVLTTADVFAFLSAYFAGC